GWAVNARARINIPFGASLTGVARLPIGVQPDLLDPFADSHSIRNRILALAALLGVIIGLWYFGVLHKVMPGLPKSSYLQHLEKQRAAHEPGAAPAGTAARVPSSNAPPAPAK